MSWDALGDGSAMPIVLVHKDFSAIADPVVLGGGCAVSSTSTIRVDGGGDVFLRCFGVRGSRMFEDASLWALDSYYPSADEYDAWNDYKASGATLSEGYTCTTFSDADSWIEYVDSAPLGTTGLTAGAEDGIIEVIAVALTTNADGTVSDPIRPVKQTCVPYKRSSYAITTDRVTAYDEAGATIAQKPGTFQVTYGDPCVIRIDSGDHHGYLMLTTRTLWQPPYASADPGDMLNDIVVWWSETAEFTEPAGPVLLVSGLDALPDQTGQFRMWISVPGGALLESPDGVESLYVYYVYHAFEPGDDKTSPPPGTEWWDTRGTGADTWMSAVRRWRSKQGVAEQGMAVKRLDLQTILDAIDAGAYSESSWAYTDAVAGDLLGHVRLWVASSEPSSGYEVRPFQAVFPYAKAVDPMPLVCDDELTLYYAANIVEGAGSRVGSRFGQGVWRAMALPQYLDVVNLDPGFWRASVPEGEFGRTDGGLSPTPAAPLSSKLDPRVETPSGAFVAVFGRDFVVRSPEGPIQGVTSRLSGGQTIAWRVPSPDLVVLATPQIKCKDPDPFILNDGTLVLYAGVAPDLPLSVHGATLDEACITYRDAFTHRIDFELPEVETWIIPPLGRPRTPAVAASPEAPWPNRLKIRGTATVTSASSEMVGFQSRLGTRCGCGAKDRGEQG